MRVVSVLGIGAVTLIGDLANAQPNRIESISTPPSSALTEFWSTQRLNQAPAMPVPVVRLGTINRVNPAPIKPRAGAPRPIPGSLARASGNVYSRPLYFGGRLAFNTPQGEMTCSAQFVAPGILATAAHCVRDENSGQWYTQFLYQHQFNRNKAQNFSTECVAAYNGWVSADDSRWTWDFAMIRLRGGTDRGHFGWQYGWWGDYDRVPKIGYPAGIEDAQVMQVEFGQLAQGWGPKIVALNHGNARNAEGSSGGAWVGKYETVENGNTESNYIISVTSHHVNDDRSVSYGPYWDNNFVELITHAQTGCK